MRYNLLLSIFLVLVIIGVLFTINFKTGNVVVEYQENYNLNDNLSGQLTLSIQQGDSLDKNTPLMISLIQNNKVIEVKTMTLEQFVLLSDNPASPVKKDSGEFYEQPQTYNVEIAKIVNYQFVTPGSYELLFNMPKIDLLVRKTINVQ